MRSLDQLMNAERPAWPKVQQWMGEALVSVRQFPVDGAQGEAVLYRLQVSAASTLGALALHSGGLVLDGGWLRVLGAGAERMAGLADWNRLSGGGARPRLLVVGHDVLGGIYAVNGGALPGGAGHIHFFDPASIAWNDLGVRHGAWLRAALQGQVRGERWEGWAMEVEPLAPDAALLVKPPLFAEDSTPLVERSRTGVAAGELWKAHRELLRQR